ncbi:adenosylcobinamide-phosphate synthase CbiB [Sinorhizobium medicae]
MSSEILLLLVMALLLDRLIGDPDWLWSRITHPVVFFGQAIGFVEKALNTGEVANTWLKVRGAVGILMLLAAAIGSGIVLARLFDVLGALGSLLEVVTVAIFLAQKSLADHVSRVAVGLRRGGVSGGRKEVSMIVGRDPSTLDEPGICRAAIESLAENFSDGVVAPAFWYAIAGLPGLLAYKMLNTANSMIGHRSPKYLRFGWASARLDDLANLPAARLSALLIAAGAYFKCGEEEAKNAIRVARRDHGFHRSPNSGWPEAAMAGAIGIQLAGPRVYGGVKVDEPMMNAAGRAAAAIEDIDAAVTVFYAACLVMTSAFAFGFLLLAAL